MRMLISAVALTLLSASVTSANPAREDRQAREAAALEKALVGKVAGKPVSCISLTDVDGGRTIGENAIIFRVSQRRLYVNKPRGGCTGLRDGRSLVTQTPTNRLCSGDIAQVVDTGLGFTGPSCTLGEFTPYTKAAS
jgi:Family of unknown function (DUF6491)